MLISLFDRAENTVEKFFSAFSPFPTRFQKTSVLLGLLKVGIMWKRVSLLAHYSHFQHPYVCLPAFPSFPTMFSSLSKKKRNLSILGTFCHFHQISICCLQTLLIRKSPFSFVVGETVNSLPNDKILEVSKFKAFANDK